MEFLSVRQCKGYRLRASSETYRAVAAVAGVAGASAHGEPKGVRERETLRVPPRPRFAQQAGRIEQQTVPPRKGGTATTSIGILIPIET